MAHHAFRLNRILMPTDLSEDAHAALRYASSLAKLSGAQLHVLHIMTVHAYDPTMARTTLDGLQGMIQAMEVHMTEEMEKRAKENVDESVQVETALVRSMSPYDAILQYASDNDVDMIVMGTRGKTGLSYVLLGSVAEKVVEYSTRPVLVVNQHERNFVDTDGTIHLDRIFCPTDFSDASKTASDLAAKMADAAHADLILAHVVPERLEQPVLVGDQDIDGADEATKQAHARLVEEARRMFPNVGKPARTVMGRGPVPETLAHLARQDAVDLIVMSSQGETNLMDRLIGSVAGHLLRLSPCPVLVVKSPIAQPS